MNATKTMVMMMINVRVSVRKSEREKHIQSKIKFNKNLKGAHTTIDETYKEAQFQRIEKSGMRIKVC